MKIVCEKYVNIISSVNKRVNRVKEYNISKLVNDFDLNACIE